MKNIYENLDIATKIYTKALFSGIVDDIDNGITRNTTIQNLMLNDGFPQSEARRLYTEICGNQDATRQAIVQIEIDIRAEEQKAKDEEWKKQKAESDKRWADATQNMPKPYSFREGAHGFSHLTHGVATFFHVLSHLFGG